MGARLGSSSSYCRTIYTLILGVFLFLSKYGNLPSNVDWLQEFNIDKKGLKDLHQVKIVFNLLTSLSVLYTSRLCLLNVQDREERKTPDAHCESTSVSLPKRKKRYIISGTGNGGGRIFPRSSGKSNARSIYKYDFRSRSALL